MIIHYDNFDCVCILTSNDSTAIVVIRQPKKENTSNESLNASLLLKFSCSKIVWAFRENLFGKNLSGMN